MVNVAGQSCRRADCAQCTTGRVRLANAVTQEEQAARRAAEEEARAAEERLRELQRKMAEQVTVSDTVQVFKAGCRRFDHRAHGCL